jgi:glycosyl hydrolase family 26
VAGVARYFAGRFQSGVAAVAVTVVAIALVAGLTAFVLKAIAPNRPAPQAASASGSAPIGSFSHHHVVITLPSSPDSYLGAYADGVPRSYASLQSLTDATGTRPDVALYYSGWGEPFQASFATKTADHHAVPLVQIDPGNVSLAAIAAGRYDSYLETFATAVASFGAQTGHGVIIGFGHEPNGTWYSWGVRHVSAATWVAAWRHIVDVFRQQGADDVTWLWTVNIIDAPNGVPSPARWWPGRSYVTWVGIDGYYYKPSWTFPSLFGPTIKAVRSLTLDPILISETAAAPAAGQPAKIANLFAGIHSYGLLGFVWFNADRQQDWRLKTPAAIAAFRQEAKSFKDPVS